MSVNNYTFNPNTGANIDLYINNSLLNSYSIPQTNPSSAQTASASVIWYNGVGMIVKISSITFSLGVNSIKYVIKNVPGYTVNSIAEYTFTNNVNSFCGQLFGYTYVDCNGNCLEDAGDFSGTSFTATNFTMASISNTFNLTSNGNIITSLPYGTYTVTNSSPCPASPTVVTIPTSNTIALAQQTVTPMYNHYTNLGFCCGAPRSGIGCPGRYVCCPSKCLFRL